VYLYVPFVCAQGSIGTLETLEVMSFDINNFRGAFPPQLCETKAPDCRVGFDHGLPALERYQAIYPWTLAMNASGNKVRACVRACVRLLQARASPRPHDCVVCLPG